MVIIDYPYYARKISGVAKLFQNRSVLYYKNFKTL